MKTSIKKTSRRSATIRSRARAQWRNLTSDLRAVANLLLAGRTDHQIAAQLGKPRASIREHAATLLRWFEKRDRTEFRKGLAFLAFAR